MLEELRRLGERIQSTSQDLIKNQTEREQKLREELNKRYELVQSGVKSQLEARQSYEAEMQKRNEERIRSQSLAVDELRRLIQADRDKYRERFVKVNDALLILDKHLDAGNKKIDRIVNAEIDARWA